MKRMLIAGLIGALLSESALITPSPPRILPKERAKGDEERIKAAEAKRARKAAKWAKQGGL